MSPPGGGKSELLAAITGLPDVHPAATMTAAALLSGTPGKEREAGAKGGLLRAIGDFGIIVCKDFGSVLSMNRDARAETLAALREIYVGSWTRQVGTGGGKTLHWQGKVGLVAGCTPSIDRHHAVMGAMGERFILFRLPDVDSREHARRAHEHAGRETTMRRELAEAVAGLFMNGKPPLEPAPRTSDDDERLVSLATLVVRARSAVERDGYSRDIELVPGSEAPTRLVVVLARLLVGLDAVGASRDNAWPIITKAALDSIPSVRRDVMDVLQATGQPLETRSIATQIGYPTTTARRSLEDLAAHGIVNRYSHGDGKSDDWDLTPFARHHYAAAHGETVPETSEVLSLIHTAHVYDDISGTPLQDGAQP